MHSFGSLVGWRQKGSPYGPQRLLWWRICILEFDTGKGTSCFLCGRGGGGVRWCQLRTLALCIALQQVQTWPASPVRVGSRPRLECRSYSKVHDGERRNRPFLDPHGCHKVPWVQANFWLFCLPRRQDRQGALNGGRSFDFSFDGYFRKAAHEEVLGMGSRLEGWWPINSPRWVLSNMQVISMSPSKHGGFVRSKHWYGQYGKCLQEVWSWFRHAGFYR